MRIRYLTHKFPRAAAGGGAVVRDGETTLVVTDVRLGARARAEMILSLLTDEEIACRLGDRDLAG